MHKKIIYLLVMSIIFLIPRVSAYCDVNEQADLMKKASKVKASYIVKTDSNLKKYIEVDVVNVTSDMFVEITSDSFSKKLESFMADENGIISFKWTDYSQVVTLNFNVYGSEYSNCYLVKLYTFKLVLPRKNIYAKSSECIGNPASLCDEFVTYDEMGYSDFLTKVKDTVNEEENSDPQDEPTNPSIIDSSRDFISHYWFYIISGIVAIMVIVVVIRHNNLKRVFK